MGELKRMCCSNAKAAKTFGFEIKYPLQVALKEYVEWFQEQARRAR